MPYAPDYRQRIVDAMGAPFGGDPAPAPAILTPPANPYADALRAAMGSKPAAATGEMALADASGVGSGPPTVVDQRPPPAPVATDAPAANRSDPMDGGVSTAPPLVSTPPPPAEAPASTQPVSAQGPSTGGTTTSAPFLNDPSDLAGPGGGTTRPARATDPQTAQDAADLNSALTEARRTSAGVRTPAHWQGNTRSMEGKVIDPRAVQEWEAAQAGLDAAEREKGEYHARLSEEMRELREGKRTFVDPMFQAQQAKLGQDYAKEQDAIAADITEQRRKLSNPNDFWEGKQGLRIGTLLMEAIEGFAQAAGGREINIGKAVDDAVKRHAEAQVRKLGFLEQKRGESKERFARGSAALEGARQAAYQALDDQVADLATRDANPIIRTMVTENVVDPAAAPQYLFRTLVDRARAAGHAIAPGYIDAPPSPQDPPMVQRLREEVRYLLPEYEAARRRVEVARERLGLAERLAPTAKSEDKFKEATTTGGKKRDPRLEMEIVKARHGLRTDDREVAVKEQDADTRAAAESGKGGEKAGARRFVMEGPLGPQEFEARPGTPDTEMTKIREQGAALSAVQREVQALEQVLTLGDKLRMNAELPARIRALAGAVNSAQGQGAMNDNDTRWFNETMGGLTTNGIGAAKAMTGYLGNLQTARMRQVGAQAVGK